MNMHTVTLARRTAVVAAAVLTSTLAAASLNAQTITACYSKQTGTLYRVGATDAPADCTSSKHAKETWSIQGPEGPQGPQGLQGLQGDPGAIEFPYAASLSTSTPLFSLTQTGTGTAAQFLGGSGVGVFGRSLSSAGVHGVAPFAVAGATGVRAENGIATGTALEITRGAIRVAGAGVGTHTAAFKVVGPVGVKGHFIEIDHPMTNGDPDVILSVTRMSVGQCHYQYGDLTILYNSNGRWVLSYSHPDDAGVSCYRSAFHILVIKP